MDLWQTDASQFCFMMRPAGYRNLNFKLKWDLLSVLSHVETLQKQLVAREAELKESRQREEEARKQPEQLSSINSKLTHD